jgi:hypothetical protein
MSLPIFGNPARCNHSCSWLTSVSRTGRGSGSALAGPALGTRGNRFARTGVRSISSNVKASASSVAARSATIRLARFGRIRPRSSQRQLRSQGAVPDFRRPFLRIAALRGRAPSVKRRSLRKCWRPASRDVRAPIPVHRPSDIGVDVQTVGRVGRRLLVASVAGLTGKPASVSANAAA